VDGNGSLDFQPAGHFATRTDPTLDMSSGFLLARVHGMIAATATGGCLCGAVRYSVEGDLRDVLVCHCVECRRSHGTSGAYTSVRREQLSFEDAQAQLRWFPGPASVTGGERGFCATCGSRLFWRAPGLATVSIAAGTLDGDTGLRTSGHIWDEQRADWEVVDDLPRAPRGGS
jgi:hypothetical protein